jgi:hypothetical protein
MQAGFYQNWTTGHVTTTQIVLAAVFIQCESAYNEAIVNQNVRI